MTEALAHTDQNREIFDHLLGRKGDATRLDPSIHTMSRHFGERLHGILEKAGFEAAFEVTAFRHTTAANALSKLNSGAICAFLGAQASHPLAFLIVDFPAASIVSEILLGGDPEYASLSASRPPTAMERDLVRQFGDLVGKALQSTLSVEECPKAIRLIQKLDEIRDGEEEEPVVTFDLTLTFGEAKPVLSLAITHHMLLQMARPAQETIKRPHVVVETGKSTAPKHVAPKRPAQNRTALTVKVPVTGSILLPAITLGDLRRLGPGDVLPLSEEGNANVKLKVKGRPALRLQSRPEGRQLRHVP